MLVPLAVVAGIAASNLIESNQFYWEGRVAAGRSLEIQNTYGSIHAEQARGDQAEVMAHQGGLRIAVTEDGRGVVIRAVAPEGGQGNSRVDFQVRVPKGVRFVARTVNGSVEANALAGDAAAYTVNGDVRLSTSGEGQAQTVNGSIVASLGATHAGKNLKFSSVNGAITLRLPRRMDARFHATTSNGAITAEFPVCVQAHSTGRTAHGILGHGGPELKLSTVNGSIQLQRARIHL